MTNHSIDYMAWLVENRAENQKITLRLLKMSKEHRDVVKSDAEIKMLIGTLASVCFSLWRAVFLGGFGNLRNADDPVIQSTEDFLENLVTTNNVVFSTDLKYNEWSFRYYMFNAQLTLNWLKDNTSSLKLIDQHCKPDVDVTIYWNSAHKYLVQAVETLESLILQRENTSSSSQMSANNPLMK